MATGSKLKRKRNASKQRYKVEKRWEKNGLHRREKHLRSNPNDKVCMKALDNLLK